MQLKDIFRKYGLRFPDDSELEGNKLRTTTSRIIEYIWTNRDLGAITTDQALELTDVTIEVHVNFLHPKK